MQLWVWCYQNISEQCCSLKENGEGEVVHVYDNVAGHLGEKWSMEGKGYKEKKKAATNT